MASAADKMFWVPLESSPEAMTAMVHRVGVDAAVGFSDVWGLDDEMLAMVPQPVRALVFLFPAGDGYAAARSREIEAAAAPVSPNVWFMKQTIGNACGTMAILHALANVQRDVAIGGALAGFFAETAALPPAERAAALERNGAIAASHAESAAQGQTAAPAADAAVEHHYAAFVVVDGDLYELDGTLPGPVNHGPATDVLRDGARAIQARIRALGDGAQTFSVIALGPAAESE
ncbi:Ubiquitin carboxyl-terminal hydrolase isozyme L3 [Coemansia javaensis]|uniref:Ubiquitin carboxyl-terminal hydrolase n=1 Tax=Coemansia javaensis TaxID=2761396 RepID=A0A9W8LFD8_9FUNG|nr:Ubiquitin carboxyl-terminal hydrolase isozyme L3 [Coemansia javaensis]